MIYGPIAMAVEKITELAVKSFRSKNMEEQYVIDREMRNAQDKLSDAIDQLIQDVRSGRL